MGSGHARRANRFNYAAIVEVAALFFGIFICMQPALQILGVEGPNLGLTEPWHYFWASGSLSSVLDNAPTYVVFFETAKSLTEKLGLSPAVAGVGGTPAGRPQPRLGLHGRQHLHRQRAELHGQVDRREVGRCDAQLLRLYVV